METTAANTEASLFAEPTQRLLDPFAEWRDHANQWDVSELLNTPQSLSQENKVNGNSTHTF